MRQAHTVEDTISDGDLAVNMESFARHLRADNLSPRTQKTYLEAVSLMAEFLAIRGCPKPWPISAPSTWRRSSPTSWNAGGQPPPPTATDPSSGGCSWRSRPGSGHLGRQEALAAVRGWRLCAWAGRLSTTRYPRRIFTTYSPPAPSPQRGRRDGHGSVTFGRRSSGV